MPDEAPPEFGEGPEPTEPEPLEAGSWKLEAGSQLDPLAPGSDVGPVPDRYARLGSEGLARLRARYAEVMARIADRPLEEDAREQLKLKAERLNPDAWVTADEVAAALEQYETVFEELRAVVGRQPRRHRRRRV